MQQTTPALTPAVWTQLIELWEDCPELFEQLAGQFSRGGRPSHGSVTVHFQGGRMALIDRRDTFK